MDWPRLKYFGESWGAPICEAAEQVPVPIGQACAYCDKTFELSDRGFIIPHLGEDIEFTPWHKACFEKHILGDLAL